MSDLSMTRTPNRSLRHPASLALLAAFALTARAAHAQIAGWDTTGDVLHASDVSQSGGARVPIPIELPPGRSGMTPTVNLTWSTQEGNSQDLGGYITLGLASVERRKPIADDDRFIYRVGGSVMPLVRCRPDAGPSRCTPVAAGQDAATTEYRLERDDGTGLRFFLETASDGGTQWASVSKAGLRTTYGADAAARLTTTQFGTAKWNMSRTVDPAGNAIFYTWANQLPWQIRYTGRFQGTDKGRYVVTFVQVGVPYASFEALDWLSSFPGNAVRNTHFVSEIKVEEDPSSGALATGWKPISRLTLAALTGVAGATPGRRGSETYFDRYGFSETGEQSAARRTTVTTSYEEVIAPGGALVLPPSNIVPGSLLVGDFNGDGRQDIAVAIHQIHWVNDPTLANWFILFGTGATYTDGGFVVNWSAPLLAPPYTVPSNILARALDLDGDGITDLINWDPTTADWHVLLGTGSGFNEKHWAAPVNLNGIPGSGMSVMTGDFDGDGRADLAVAVSGSPVHWKLHLSTGTGFTLVDWTLSDPNVDNVTLDFAESDYNEVRVVTGDFNGDRRTDLAWYRNTAISPYHYVSQWYLVLSPAAPASGNVTPTRWNGPSGSQLPKTNYPATPYQVLSGDFNGDGLTDIDLVKCSYDAGRPVETSYRCTRNVYTWRNGAGLYYTGSGEPYGANTWPKAIIAGDFDGDGRTEVEFAVPSGTGVVWRDYIRLYPPGTPTCEPTTPPTVVCIPAFTGLYGSSTSPAPSCLQYIPGDFNGSGRTDMACIQGDYKVSTILDGPETLAFKNDTGGSVSYVLEGASRYNAAPTAQTTPQPVNPLPFPVRVVTSKTEDDGLGNPVTTSYTYSGSHTDIVKGEFRGFRTVEEIGPGSPVVKAMDYHRGAFAVTGEEEDFRGRPQRITRWVTAPIAELMQQVDFVYTRNQTDAIEAKVVLPDSVTTTDVNLPRDSVPHYPDVVPGSRVVKTEEYAYDAYGNRTKTTVSGTAGPTLTVETPFKPPMALANGDLVHVVDFTRTWSDGTLLTQKNYIEYYQATDFAHQQGKLKKVKQTYCSLLDAADFERLAGCFDPAVVLDYDTAGRLAEVQEATSNVDFRTVARILTTEDGDGTTVTVTRQADGLTFTTTTHQDWRFGKQDQATDENGKVDATIHDAFGRVSSQTASMNGVTLSSSSVEYVDHATSDAPSHRITTTQLAAGESATTKEYVDGLGRVIRTVTRDESGGSTAYLHAVKQYDSAGRLLGVMGPFRAATDLHTVAPPTTAGFPWSRINYGLDGIVYGLVQSDGTRGYFGTSGLTTATGPTTTFTYFGQVTTTTDPDGVVTDTTTDYAGRIVKVLERRRSAPGGPLYSVPTDYAYRADGLLLSVLGPEGSCNDSANPLGRCLLSSIKYDPLGRRIEVRDPTFKDPAAVEAQGAAAPSLAWQYFYATNGALDHVGAPSGATTSYLYDGFDRPTTKCLTAPGATTCERVETYGYDQTFDSDTGSADYGRGRLGSVTVTQGGMQLLVDRFHYDAMGRNSAVARTLSGWSGTQVTRFAFDLGGRLQTLTYPDATVLTYAYHTGSSRLRLLSGTALGVGQQVTVPQYDPLGQAGLVTTDVQTSYHRDPWSGRLQRTTIGPAADGSVADMGFGLTAAGRISTFTDYRLGQLIGATPAKVDFSYGYDDVGRLTGEAVPAAIPGDLSRSATLLYDPVVGRPSGLASVTDLLRGAFAFSYDKDGNTTMGVNLSGAAPSWRTFTYGVDGMPSAIGGVLAAFYDQGGQRAIKGTCGATTCPATSTTFYFGPHYEVRNGVPTRYVFAMGQRIAKVDASGTAYVHKDHRDSTVAVTSGGATIWRASYQLFGALRTECADGTLGACAPNIAVMRPVPYLFGDHEHDQEVGLYYFGARYYDPVVGRFTSPDTIIPRPFDPQSHNRYAFQRNDPLNRVDPDGHADCVYGYCGWVTSTYTPDWTSGPPGWDQPDTWESTFGDPWGGYGGYGYYYGGYTASPPPAAPVPSTLGSTGSSVPAGQQLAAVTSTPSAKTFRSPYILRLIVPGQVAWDDAMTAWMNGEYVEGLAYSGETVTEVVLYVWSAGQTKLAGVAGRLGQASDWVRFGETTVSNQLTIGRGAEGVTRTWAIKGGGVNPRTGFSLPFHYHLHKYNWYKPWLWFEETPVLW